MATVTSIVHLPGYSPSGPASETARTVGSLGRSGNLQVTGITHADGDTVPAGTASELHRWADVLPAVDANRAEVAAKVSDLIAQLETAHSWYTAPTRTLVDRQNFIVDRFDDLLRGVALLARAVSADYDTPGI